MRYLPLVLALSASCFASIAHAEETSERSATPPAPASAGETAGGWYGWQTLIADGASVAVTALGAASQIAPVGFMGVGGYLLGAPSVHVAHGNPGRAVGSLLLRAGLPVLGFAAGAAAFHQPDSQACAGREECWNFSGLAEGLALGLAGIATSVALDAAVFARESAPSAIDSDRAPSPTKATATPQLGYVRGGAVVGVGGRF
jgi:hypothetical protein